MMNDAFKSICDKVEEALAPRGFEKVKSSAADENEMVALFVSENLAYSVVYYKDNMHMVMRECAMTDDGPDNDWRTLATWLFDPDSDSMKEANSIANDFVAAVSAEKAIKKQKTAKKSKSKKNSDEGNADPLFFSKRLVNLFPELKEEIKDEEDYYYPFRGVTFAKEKICPKVNELVRSGDKARIKKLVDILSAQYSNGDVDTRSIITIVVLNGVDEKYDATLEEYMSDDLKKAAVPARKYRTKTVKPEKVKKKKPTIAERLTDRR